MKFSDALAARRPVHQLGAVRLRYDVDVLVAERRPSLRWRRLAPDLIFGGAGALAVGAAAVAITGGDAAVVALLAAAAAGAALAALRAEVERRARRGFVLHFAARTLRVDRPSRWLGRPSSETFPFSAVREAGVTQPSPGVYALEVELDRGPGEPPRVETLIADVPGRAVEDLFRVSDLLRDAVGLTPPRPEPER